MRRNLMFLTLTGVMVAAVAPSAQARTADHVPNCAATIPASSNTAPPPGCGILNVCVSDLTGSQKDTPSAGVTTYTPANEGSGQFEIEGQSEYYLSKILNAYYPSKAGNFNTFPSAALPAWNPDPGAAGNVAPGSPVAAGVYPADTTVNTATQTAFPCIGDVNPILQNNNDANKTLSDLQFDDTGISVPAGLYTIYGGKYNSANCLATVNGQVVEQPSGGLVYAGTPGSQGPSNQAQRCKARVHHFHVGHDDLTPNSNTQSAGTTTSPPSNQTGGIGQSVIEQDHITVYVAAGQKTSVFAHMVDVAYPDCQESATPTPNRVCQPTPGPTGP